MNGNENSNGDGNEDGKKRERSSVGIETNSGTKENKEKEEKEKDKKEEDKKKGAVVGSVRVRERGLTEKKAEVKVQAETDVEVSNLV